MVAHTRLFGVTGPALTVPPAGKPGFGNWTDSWLLGFLLRWALLKKEINE